MADFASWKEQAEPETSGCRSASTGVTPHGLRPGQTGELERMPADPDDDDDPGVRRSDKITVGTGICGRSRRGEHTFTFVCLPYGRWRTLVEGHAPSKEQERNGWEWNPETFGPAAVAAACQTPELDARMRSGCVSGFCPAASGTVCSKLRCR
jgi:hypothetical protein